MEAGQVNNIGYIIQARIESSRLPGKVLQNLPIGGKRNILDWIIDEVSKLEGKIVVATSTNNANDKIEQFCENKKVECFRGDENDVLSRFVEVQKRNKFTHIVRLTADNPFIDAKTIRQVLDFHIENNFDYTYSHNLPLGMNIEVMKGESLLLSCKHITNEREKEHVTIVLSENKNFTQGEFHFNTEQITHLRVTVDTIEDFLVANAIATFSEYNNITGVDLIKNIYSKNPFIFQVNDSIYQKKVFSSVEEELEEACLLLRKNDLKESEKIIKKHINENY